MSEGRAPGNDRQVGLPVRLAYGAALIARREDE